MPQIRVVTLSKRFLTLVMTMLLFITLFGAMSYYYASQLLGHLSEVSQVKLPAIKNQTLADMMHDGLRGVVMESLYLHQKGERESLKALNEEIQEKINNFRQYFSELQKLKLSSDTRKLIQQAGPVVEQYLTSSKNIGERIISEESNKEANKEELILKDLKQFSQSFDELEEKMGVMGEGIQQEAFSINSNGNVILMTQLLTLGIIIICSCFIAWVLIRRANQSFAAIGSDLIQAVSSTEEASQHSQLAAQSIAAASVEQNQAAASCVKLSQQTQGLVEKTHQLTKNSLDKLRQIVDKSQEGSKGVEQLIQAINSLTKVGEDFKELVLIIKGIENKTTIINDIVFKTQILSFNASIEAARAGDYGKGFSVVAEEISKLAVMSGQSAANIQDLLVQSNKKVETVGLEVLAQVEESTKASEYVDLQMKMITTNLDEIETEVSAIASICQEEVQSMMQSNTALEQITQSSKSNSQSAQSSLKYANQAVESTSKMKNVADLINQIVGKGKRDQIKAA